MRATKLLSLLVCACGFATLSWRSVSAADNASSATAELTEPPPLRDVATLTRDESPQEVVEPLVVPERQVLLCSRGRLQRCANLTKNAEEEPSTTVAENHRVLPRNSRAWALMEEEVDSEPTGSLEVDNGDPTSVRRRRDVGDARFHKNLPKVVAEHVVQPLNIRPKHLNDFKKGLQTEIVEHRLHLKHLASQTEHANESSTQPEGQVQDVEAIRKVLRQKLRFDTPTNEEPPAELSEDQIRGIGASLDKRHSDGDMAGRGLGIQNRGPPGTEEGLPTVEAEHRIEKIGTPGETTESSPTEYPGTHEETASDFRRQLQDYDTIDGGPVYEVPEEKIKDIDESLHKRINASVEAKVSRRRKCKERPRVGYQEREDVKPGHGKHSHETVDLMHRILALLHHGSAVEDCEDDASRTTPSRGRAMQPGQREFMSGESEHTLEELNKGLSNSARLQKSRDPSWDSSAMEAR